VISIIWIELRILYLHEKVSHFQWFFLSGFRQSPYYQPVDEEVEAHHLRFLQQPPSKFFEAIARFNANISYNGLMHAVTQDTLFAENKEKLIVQGLTALLANECKSK